MTSNQDDNITPEPIVGTDADSKYLIHSGTEIIFILRAIMQKGAMVTVYFNDGNDFILTTILEVDAGRGEVVLDYGAISDANERLQAANKIIFVTAQDRIKVQFAADRIKKTAYQGRDAFFVPIPQTLLRIQRREYYRAPAPVGRPLRCTIPLNEDGIPGKIEVGIVDLSCGGMALIAHPHEIEFESGAIYSNCRIVLPDVGTLVTTIEIRSTFGVSTRSGEETKRTGCQFVDMTEAKMAMIQRYIIKLERERKARLTGLG